MLIIILLILCVLILDFLIYLMFRNDRVALFKMTLNHFAYGLLIKYLQTFENDSEFHSHKKEYEYLQESVKHLVNKHRYEDMLFSFKPLKMDDWYTDEDTRFMREYKQFMPEADEVSEDLKKVLPKRIVRKFNV